MKKLSVFAFASAIALALAAAPADAATKKKKGGKSGKPAAAKVEKRPSGGVFVQGYYGCVNSFGVFAAVGAVGCGAVYSVPVMIEGFTNPQAGGKA